jgi:hypothetical protein
MTADNTGTRDRMPRPPAHEIWQQVYKLSVANRRCLQAKYSSTTGPCPETAQPLLYREMGPCALVGKGHPHGVQTDQCRG